MIVLRDGHGHVAGRRFQAGFVHTFPRVPAVVLATRRGGRLPVDFLVRRAAHVGDPQIARGHVEAEAPRIAQAIGPDFRQRPRLPHKRVVLRHGIAGAFAAHIDAQDLAQPRAQVLRVAVRVPLRAAVTESDVQVAIRAESEHAAIVIGERLRLRQDDLGAGRIDLVGVVLPHAITRHNAVARGVRIAGVQAAAAGVVRREGQPQQSAFAVQECIGIGADQRGQVEKRRLQHGAVRRDDAHTPALLQHEQPATAIAGMRDEQRTGEALRDALQAHRIGGRRVLLRGSTAHDHDRCDQQRCNSSLPHHAVPPE